MKLFVGIELDSPLVDAVSDVIDELKRRSERQAPRSRVVWVTRERVHVTVRFIGHQDDAVSERIRVLFEAPIAVRPFRLNAERLGSFPPTGTPRVLWAGLSGDVEHLNALERAVTNRLLHVGVPPDARAYSPHLTLGRVKEPGGLKSAALFRGLETTVLGTSSVQAITLFESRVSSKGPTYIPLVRSVLTGA